MRKSSLDPMPWRFLEEYRGKYFSKEWPSLPQMFDIMTERFPDNRCFEAFTPKHVTFTYTEARAQFDKVARWLFNKGVRKGDRVAVTGKNSPEWAIAYMGIVTMGAIVVPVDAALTTAEIEHLVDFVEIKGIFLDGDRFDALGLDGKYGFKVSLEERGHEDDYILNLPDAGMQPISHPDSDDLAAFLFTSGTTGTPKAVMLSHENLVFDAYCVQAYMNVRDTDVFYAILPIHHAYTMVAVFIESMANGSNVVFGKRLVVTSLLKEMKEGHVNMLLAVPMLYNKIFTAIMKGIDKKGAIVRFLVKTMMKVCGFIKQTTGLNPGRVIFRGIRDKVSLADNRICISGAGPLPEETFKGFNQLGVDFIQGYGLTETSPIVTLNPAYSYQYSSIGKPFPGVEVDFINKDEQGNGEIITRGKHVMKGYYKNPEATAEVIDKNGYLHSGDLGVKDEQGFYKITGRIKDMIIRGGENIYPREIEEYLYHMPGIRDVQVAAVPSKKYGEAVGAFIILEEGVTMTPEDVQLFCRGKIARYKIPKYVFFIDQFPLTGSGKIQKFKLKEMSLKLCEEQGIVVE